MKRRSRGDGSVYPRADGKWAGALDLGSGSGRRRRKVVYGNSRSEVQAKLRAVQRTLDAGLQVLPERLTVGRFLDSWLSETVRPSVRPKTYVGYEQIVRVHLGPAIGHLRLAALDPRDVQAMLNAKRASGLSPRTVQSIRAVLRTALNRAVKWGLLSRNVAALTDGPHVEHRQLTVFTPVEARRFVDAVGADRDGPLYITALGLGLRQGEALALRWADIDFDLRTVSVARSLSRASGHAEFVEPKTARSARSVALPAFVAATLREHRKRQLGLRVMQGPRWSDQGLVFSTSTGTAMDGPNVTKRFKRVLSALGFEPMRFHDLRHSFASLQLALGVDARVVMETLGHSDIRLTLNTYTHVIPELQHDAAGRLDGMLQAPDPADATS